MNLSFHNCISYSEEAFNRAEGITHHKHCVSLPSWVSPPSIHPSVSLLLYLICSPPPRLPRFLLPLQPLPSPLLCLIHHLSPFFFLSTCVFSRTGEREEDGLRRWAGYGLSFVLLICFISVWGWEEMQRQCDRVRLTSPGCLSNLFHFCIINYNMTQVKHELTS